jgi:hypothetical protein
MRASVLKNRWAVLLILCWVGLLSSRSLPQAEPLAFQPDRILKARPPGKALVHDYAHILPDALDYSNDYLARIRDRYRIEAMIVTVPRSGADRTIEMLANELFERWQIGRQSDDRGILLLLSDERKQVKLEVSKELEDVFTDAFCGYIEDLQLKPYFLAGQLGTGLLAVMEEIENRAQLKRQGEYTPQSIAGLDQRLLSQGAGARRELRQFAQEEVKAVGNRYPAGKTPAEAWETLLQSWRAKARDPNLGVYTAVTRLAYRDYQNLPDSRYEKDVLTYAGKPYEVMEKGDAAVIFFSGREGWDNAPFLFCRTPEGWQFDLVHQRKYIRMGKNPAWGIERADYPYIDLLNKCPYFQGQDIPLEAQDVYRIEADASMAERILSAEARLRRAPEDPAALMDLGRLYTIVSMGQKAIPLLKKAKALDPAAALPYKYLAILHVDMFYQYEQAIQELGEYAKRRPEDVFGRNYLGYLNYQLKRYSEAVDQLQMALNLRADNCYAYCLLSRAYGQLFLAAWALDPRKSAYKKSSLEMLQQAAATATPNPRRIGWLKGWLRGHKILTGGE